MPAMCGRQGCRRDDDLRRRRVQSFHPTRIRSHKRRPCLPKPSLAIFGPPSAKPLSASHPWIGLPKDNLIRVALGVQRDVRPAAANNREVIAIFGVLHDLPNPPARRMDGRSRFGVPSPFGTGHGLLKGRIQTFMASVLKKLNSRQEGIDAHREPIRRRLGRIAHGISGGTE